jgi:hypothetical protein
MVTPRISFQYRSQTAAKLLVGLIGLEVFLAVAHIYIFVGPGVPWDIVRFLLDLDSEVALTTWFATVQLFAIGAVLLLAAWANEEETTHSLSPVLALGGLLFVFLSADEGAGIHERLTPIIEDRGLDALLFPGNHGGWISVYAVGGSILLLTAGLYLRRPLQQIWQRFPRETLIVVGGFVAIVLGAVGFEIMSYFVLRVESMADLYQLEVAIEEFLEMAGASGILYASLEIAAVLCSERSPQPVGSHT